MTVDTRDKNFEALVREGILAARDGRIGYARRMLLQATRINPFDARPWLWLSQTTSDKDERLGFLERAVVADPANSTARRGLAILKGLLDESKILPEGQGVAAQEPGEPLPAAGEVYQCPQCGGRMEFGPQNGSLVCEYCRYEEVLETRSEPEEQVIDLILPTAKGHRWAEASHMLACEKCGAHTLMEAGEKSISCPYCGSNQVIESEETLELIEPHQIGLMAVEEEQIPSLVNKWLKQGMYTPDDLSQAIKHLEFRPAYYPFWLFSGTLEAHWNCEVREGSSQNARWAPRSGTEVLLFDDLLVSGITGISDKLVKDLKPFLLDELETFVPDQLAGWPGLAYDRSMADASLLAREAFVNEARSILARRVEPGSERREFRVGGGKWSGMAFKLVLLPLWVGVYQYMGTEYRVIVNGQTGKVAGQKPQDEVKKALIWAAGLGTIVVIGLIAAMALLLFNG